MPDPVLTARGRHLWAKSAESPPGHPLLAHMIDVGLTAAELLTRRPQPLLGILTAELEIGEEDARLLCQNLAALHDLGKATPAFQAKWPPGAPAEALAPHRLSDVPHGRATAVFLRDLLREAGFGRKATGLANAVAIHHGMRMTQAAMTAESLDPRSLGSGVWDSWRQALWEDVQAVFGVLRPPGRPNQHLSGRSWVLLAGLTSVADWIGSSLPYVAAVADPVEYAKGRIATVRARLAEIAWPESVRWTATDPTEPFSAWFGSDGSRFEPRPLQAAIEEVSRKIAPPFLLVIEAPMGEGKTETAFYTAGLNSQLGLYVGLPTQATSDAMHGRLASFVRQHETRPTYVALAHSAAGQMRRLATPPAFDEEGIEAEADAEDWFASTKRALLAEIGAGTVDQALRSVLPARHFFVRLWGLAHKLVVLDEVHAYETFTSSLIAELLAWLGSVGAPAVLMSATLPRDVRRELVQAYAEGAGLSADLDYSIPYPRVTAVGRDGTFSVSFEASTYRSVRVVPAPYDVDDLARAAMEAVSTGAGVAVIVNTVDRAQRLFTACRGVGLDPALVHARFPLDERKRREAEVMRRYGRDSSPEVRPGLVIGTQVLEQSLDVDFDVMFTDLAPVDLVLQRAGRLHRHASRARPGGAADALLHIAGLHGADASEPHPEALDTVYDRYVMWRSWALLTGKSSLRLPDDIDELVQLAYGDEPLAALEPHGTAVVEALRTHEALRTAQRGAAQNWSLARPLDPAVQSWGEPGVDEDEERAYTLKLTTRLGDDSVTVVPVVPGKSRWAVAGTAVATPIAATRASEQFVDACLARQLRVSNKALIERLRRKGQPAWWRRSGPLRNMYPLPLGQDGTYLDDERVRLDEELGLVIERSE